MASPDEDARLRADKYKNAQEGETPAHPPAQRKLRTPEEWQDLVSQRIEEAMRAGKFENLPGKGKPLNPDPDPHVPADMKMANSLLKNNDLAPAWIAERSEILAGIERLRARLARTAGEFRRAREAAATPAQRQELDQAWQGQVDAWAQEIAALNRRILVHNLKQPVQFLEIWQLRIEDEVRRAEQ